MATYISYRDGGKTDEVGLSRMTSKLWTGNVLEGLTVEENNPLAMNVVVTPGDIKINHGNGCYYGWSDSNATVTIATADTSNPRVDRIVAYIDTTQTPTTEQANNPGLLKFAAVTGTPSASPSAPSDTTVQNAIGVGNPYTDLAHVGVPAGVTQITNTSIDPMQHKATLDSRHLADHSVTPFYVYRTGRYTVTNQTFTKVPYNAVVYDENNYFNTTTNRFVAPVDGVYVFNVSIAIENVSNYYRYICQLNSNNNNAVTRLYDGKNGAQARTITGTGLVVLNANDWIEVHTWHDIGNTRSYPDDDKPTLYFKGALLRSL